MKAYSCKFQFKCPHCGYVNVGMDAAVNAESLTEAAEDVFERVHICDGCNRRLLDKTEFIIDCKPIAEG